MKRKGFTLIELMVVIAIICIIAGMLIPAIRMARNRAKGGTATQSVNHSDPTQSPISSVAAPAPAANNAYTLQFNDSSAFRYAQRTLTGAGLKVESVNDKSSLVFDPNGVTTK